ncbi:PA0069 family radical SAM protein [uncultured Maritimibacter sp.]|jgi:DNA repair photolyase|uniref:PA0069 family radical SAM protein n=1 Tax=uncultured Maritimibacter sp. TaxID=991866 RepID=UPI000AAC8A39|nr:PA0069 family radical SAM protein [uncultured Maritimibacter sp.]
MIESRNIEKERRRSRGAGSNETGRFERLSRVEIDDGWEREGEAAFKTEVRLEVSRSAITKNTSPDVSFDRSINPYRGCEHGCVYCFARPSHAWLGMSPGLDFETRLVARPGIGAVLARELGRKSYRPATIAIGTNTDPYQPIEGKMRVMREVLEVLWAHRHPVGIVTKGTLIERDLDLLAPMAAEGLVHVGVSVTTLDRNLARRMEPRCPTPARRLETIRALSAAGVPVRVMASPMIPALTDAELENILTAGREAGARAASWIMLRLPLEVSALFRDWLGEHYPERAARIMGHLREMHGGKDYDPTFGKRMRGEGAYAELIARRFEVAKARLGFEDRLPALALDKFRVPREPSAQLELF